MIWDLFQSWKIEETGRSVEKLSNDNRTVASQSQEYVEKVKPFALATQAVRSFLKEKYHLDDQDLIQRMKKIDVLDRIRDGKYTPLPANCSGCNRRISSKVLKCRYCGTESPNYNPFSD